MDRSFLKLAFIHQIRHRLRKYFLFLALMALAPATHAQNTYQVNGRVINREGEPMMGNVVALSVKDSSFLKGDSFLDGNFELLALNGPEVLIRLSSLQFQDTVLHVVFTEKYSVDLGTIVVDDRLEMLHEVEVVASVPLFTARPDGVMEVNVANTVLASSNSVNEILTRSPNITTDDDGISVFGKGQAILYLNGKRITQERLSSISASQVKNIEIITNPSAMYDAEGRAVINIITKDNLQDGYRAMVQQQATWSDRAGATTSTMVNFNYKKKRIDVAGNYDLKLGDDRETLYTTRARVAEEDYLHSQIIWDRQREYKNASNYSLGASYDLGGRGYASLEYNGAYEGLNDPTLSRNHLVTATENGLYTTHASRKVLNRNNSVTMNVNHIFDSLGSSFFAGGQLSRFASMLHDDITENNVVNDQEVIMLLRSKQNSEITIFNPQIDVVKVYAGGRKLSMGMKLSYAKVLSTLRFYNAIEDDYQLDQKRSNDFEYRETVPAAYVQYEGTLSTGLTYGFGIRSEWTRYTLHTTAQNQDGTFQSSYVNLFPNAQINIAVSPALKLRALYTSRITRPPYQTLSPSLIYQDAFTSVEGNPNLRPEKTHSFELGAAFKMFDLSAGCNYSIDPLSGGALRGADEKSYVLKRINLSKGHSYFTALSASFSNRWLSSTNTINVSYSRLVTNQYEFEPVGERPQVYAYSSNKINAGGIFTLHVLGWYRGENYRSLYYDNSRSIVTVGMEKDLFNKFLKCSLTANDIFFKSNPAGSYSVGQTFILYNRLFNTRYYRVALICNIGQLKKASYKIKSIGEAESNRAR